MGAADSDFANAAAPQLANEYFASGIDRDSARLVQPGECGRSSVAVRSMAAITCDGAVK